MDRYGKLYPAFRTLLKNEDIKPMRLPPRSPNLNAYVERFHRSLKEECLNRMIFFGEKSLRKAIDAFLDHFHTERNHQGLGNRLIEPGEEVGLRDGGIFCQERLEGMLQYYYRKAA
jgi:putative transposase